MVETCRRRGGDGVKKRAGPTASDCSRNEKRERKKNDLIEIVFNEGSSGLLAS